MIWIFVGLLIAASLFLSAFFAGAEMGIYSINRLRLHLGEQQNERQAVRLALILKEEQGAVFVTLIGTNAMNYVLTSAVAFVFAEHFRLSGFNTELYTVVLLTPVVFVLAEVVPKNLFQANADTLMLRGSRLLQISERIIRLTGLVWLLQRIAGLVLRFASSSEELRSVVEPKRRVALLLREAMAGDSHAEEQSEMIDRVCRLSETAVSRVMTPGSKVETIGVDATRHEFLKLIRHSPYARLPVYDANRRHFVGLIKIDELLQDETWVRVQERVRPILSLLPQETVATAITRMETDRHEMAVVTDRGGQMLGVVTLKELLTDVMGEMASGA